MVAADSGFDHIRNTHGTGNRQLHGVLKVNREGLESFPICLSSFIFHLSIRLCFIAQEGTDGV